MSRSLRRLAALAPLGLAIAALTLVSPAYAADGDATIDHAQPEKGAVKLLVSVPGSDPVDLSSVGVTIGGQDVAATADDAARSDDVRRTTVLAIDTSNSMSGARIREARKAALAYLATVPANVEVGIVTFDDTVETLLAPGTDRAAARSAIAGLALARHTALYDGVVAAIDAAGTTGQREVLLLSDGKDTTTTSLGSVVDRIRKSGVKLDAVSLQQSDQESKPLNDMAAAGKGSVLDAANPTALTAAYAQEAQLLARQVLVTATVPVAQKSTDADVSVTLAAGDQQYTASAFVPVQAAARPADSAPTASQEPQRVTAGALSVPKPVVLGAIGAIGVGLVGIALLLGSGGREETGSLSIEEQIGTYGASGRKPRRRGQHHSDPSASLADQAKGVAQRALANNSTTEARIAHRLEAAGMALTPAEWVLLHGGIAIGLGLLGGLLGAGNPVLIVMFLALGVVGPWVFLGLKRSRRLKAFDTHLADTLQLMSGSLSAGLSLAQSLDTIVREGTEPISSEFRRVIVEARLGVELEEALEGVAERMGSKDFKWVVMAIRIQREVGGNLAELLLTVAATLREREYIRRHVSALSAEGRLSCWILGGLPPVFMLYLTLTKPTYVHPMFTTPIGLAMCIVMAMLLGVGIFWMSKVAKVEI